MAGKKKRSPIVEPDGTRKFFASTSVIPGFGLSIGITLTENGAMYPQSSLCGLYIASAHARYFVL